MTVGAPECVLLIVMKLVLISFRFFGPLVEEQMRSAANRVDIAEVFENCGHILSLEQPERLANLLKKFVLELYVTCNIPNAIPAHLLILREKIGNIPVSLSQ